MGYNQRMTLGANASLLLRKIVLSGPTMVGPHVSETKPFGEFYIDGVAFCWDGESMYRVEAGKTLLFADRLFSDMGDVMGSMEKDGRFQVPERLAMWLEEEARRRRASDHRPGPP
jgi:hypothetical protein